MTLSLSTVCVFATLALLPGSTARAQEAPDPGPELRRTTQEMLDAIAPGHAHIWDKHVHERLVHVDESGVVRGKAELLKELTPLPKGLVGRIAIDTFKLETHGTTAVVAAEVQEHLDYHGQILRSRFRMSDTWLKTPQGWKLIAQQVAAVLKDPPAIKLVQAQLCAYDGSYALTEGITTTIRCAADDLVSERTGRPAAKYVAEFVDVFFVPGQPRTRRIFLRDDKGAVIGFADRREGEDIRWTKSK
jgi:hypothetical protein